MAYKNILAKNINTDEVIEDIQIDTFLFEEKDNIRLYYNKESKKFELEEITEENEIYKNIELEKLQKYKTTYIENLYLDSKKIFTVTDNEKTKKLVKSLDWFCDLIAGKASFRESFDLIVDGTSFVLNNAKMKKIALKFDEIRASQWNTMNNYILLVKKCSNKEELNKLTFDFSYKKEYTLNELLK